MVKIPYILLVAIETFNWYDPCMSTTCLEHFEPKRSAETVRTAASAPVSSVYFYFFYYACRAMREVWASDE